ncbi:MAG TPA: UDP-N-acetylmuramate dehydrogenase [bacterium]|nr:UDP-N-acetylmuramate dehydrogenase [bacterium]
MTLLSDLRAIPGLVVRPEVHLSGYTTFRIGGPAEILAEANNEHSLLQVVEYCRKKGSPCRFMGGGSNLLVADEGLAGVVLLNKVRFVEWKEPCSVRVSGGFPLDEFVSLLAEKGWAGLDFAAGIPGTVGGGLAGGAGAYGNLLGDFLDSARILDVYGNIRETAPSALGIGYRESKTRDRGDLILDATFHRLQPAPPEQVQAKIREIKSERASKHPGSDLPSAGSFFKNLPPSEPGGKRIPAGKLLDEVGAKGLRVGDAEVFEKHANIIVNRGKATARDVNNLADEMAKRVYDCYGIQLNREVLYWS